MLTSNFCSTDERLHQSSQRSTSEQCGRSSQCSQVSSPAARRVTCYELQRKTLLLFHFPYFPVCSPLLDFFFSFFFFKPKPVTPHLLLTLLTSCYFYLRWLTFTANGADLAVGVSVAAAYGSRDGSFSCQRRHISLHSTASLPWHRMRNNFRCKPTHWCNTVEYFSSTIPTGCAALYQKLHTITVLQYTLRMYFYFWTPRKK